jgi:dihydrolipoamide dehydrogenase
VHARKKTIVEQLHKGVQYLMKKNSIEVVYGHGRIVSVPGNEDSPGVIAVTAAGEESHIAFDNLIIATGSRPRSLPGLVIDGKYVITSEEALDLDTLPASIVILGGGAIGVEWASMLNDFGVEVTIVEFEGRLLPLEDADVSKELQRLFAKRGIKVLTGAKLLPESLETGTQGINVQVEQAAGLKVLTADKLLVAVGREANVVGFGLEQTGVRLERGVIAVNEAMRTDVPNIYAIGDVIGGLQLAHVASHEGICAVETIAGKHPEPIDLTLVPRCIYGRPEIASVGITEQQAAERGHEVKTGKFSFKGIGKSLIYGSSDGFVKVVADARDNAILGVHMIGPHVTDYIGEASLAQLLGATTLQVGKMIHPHPTLSEIIGEAMLAADGAAIHM